MGVVFYCIISLDFEAENYSDKLGVPTSDKDFIKLAVLTSDEDLKKFKSIIQCIEEKMAGFEENDRASVEMLTKEPTFEDHYRSVAARNTSRHGQIPLNQNLSDSNPEPMSMQVGLALFCSIAL